jgi:hypothetical protein
MGFKKLQNLHVPDNQRIAKSLNLLYHCIHTNSKSLFLTDSYKIARDYPLQNFVLIKFRTAILLLINPKDEIKNKSRLCETGLNLDIFAKMQVSGLIFEFFIISSL